MVRGHWQVFARLVFYYHFGFWLVSGLAVGLAASVGTEKALRCMGKCLSIFAVILGALSGCGGYKSTLSSWTTLSKPEYTVDLSKGNWFGADFEATIPLGNIYCTTRVSLDGTETSGQITFKDGRCGLRDNIWTYSKAMGLLTVCDHESNCEKYF